jgi:hypothetical protein
LLHKVGNDFTFNLFLLSCVDRLFIRQKKVQLFFTLEFHAAVRGE